MIKVLHGENIVESRKALSELISDARAKGYEIVVLNGAAVGFSELRGALESSSLFGKNKLVVIESLLSSPISATKTNILKYLAVHKFDNDLILWEQKEIQRTVLDQLPKGEIKLFRISPVIFRFLESIRPGNTKQMLLFLQEAKIAEKEEIIFYMLVRQIRLFLLAKDGDGQNLSHLPDWQQKKLLAQAKYFTLDELKNIYQKLLEIDFSQKTSQDPYPLASRLDLLVSSF